MLKFSKLRIFGCCEIIENETLLIGLHGIHIQKDGPSCGLMTSCEDNITK